MKQFGIDVDNLTYRGMLAFVSVKGKPDKAVSLFKDENYVNVKLDVTGKLNN